MRIQHRNRVQMLACGPGRDGPSRRLQPVFLLPEDAMALEWIAMRHDLPEDPDVLRIAQELNYSDPDFVIGKLHRIWTWADKHTVDGRAHHVTFVTLDSVARCDGLCNALVQVGWLAQEHTDDGPCTVFPGFDVYTSQSAKRRALETKRRRANRTNVREHTGQMSAECPTVQQDRASATEQNRTEQIQNNEQRKEHTGARAHLNGFAHFWEIYPRKVNRKRAEQAWTKLAPSEELAATITEAVTARAAGDPQWRELRYVPHASTYLRGAQWEDDWESAAESGKSKTLDEILGPAEPEVPF